jgi:hypothetical protein
MLRYGDWKNSCAAGLAAAAASFYPALAAPPETGTCSPTAVKYLASSKDGGHTNSTTPVTIPQGTVNFKQGGSGPSCVIVRFSGQAVVSASGDLIIIAAQLDGATAAVPNQAAFAGDTSANVVTRSHAFDFVFPDVAPGNHTLRMQYMSTLGTSVQMDRHTIVIHYAP